MPGRRERPRIPKFHSTYLMRQLGLELNTTSVSDLIEKDASILYFDYANFEFSDYNEGIHLLPLPATQIDIINVLEFVKNAHKALETTEITEQIGECTSNLRRSLMMFLIARNELVGERIFLEELNIDEYEEQNPSSTLISDDDIFAQVETEIFVLIMRCYLLQLYIHDYSDITCEEMFPYIIQHRLIPGDIRDKPIMEYDPKELMNCFKLIAEDFHMLRFDPQLPLFLDLLAYRLAMMTFIPIPEHEIPMDLLGVASTVMPSLHKIGHYTMTYEVIRNQGWALTEMWFKMELYMTLTSNDGERLPIPKFNDYQRNLLYSRVINTDPDGHCKSEFRLFCLQSVIRPGEKDHYINTTPNSERRVDYIIRRRPGSEDQAERWMEYLDKDTNEIVKDPSLFNQCISESAFMYLMCHYLDTEVNTLVKGKYVWFSTQLVQIFSDMSVQLERPYPMILQGFNYYGVYYKNQFYEHDNIVDVILHWMSILWAPPFKGFLEDISLQQLNMIKYNFRV